MRKKLSGIVVTAVATTVSLASPASAGQRVWWSTHDSTAEAQAECNRLKGQGWNIECYYAKEPVHPPRVQLWIEWV